MGPELGGRGGMAGGVSSVKSTVACLLKKFSFSPFLDMAPTSMVDCRVIDGRVEKVGRGGGAGASSGISTAPCFGSGGGGSSGEGKLKSSGVLTLLLVVPSLINLSLRVVGGVLELALTSKFCDLANPKADAGFNSDGSKGPCNWVLAIIADVSNGSGSLESNVATGWVKGAEPNGSVAGLDPKGSAVTDVLGLRRD